MPKWWLCLVLTASESPQLREYVAKIVGDSFAANLISPIWMLLKDQPGISLSARITFACSFMPNGFASWDGECGKARSFIESLHASEVTDIIFHINFVKNSRTVLLHFLFEKKNK